MCAIIGIKCDDAELGQFVMSELLNQSQIRGKHATGISYVDSGEIETITKPICSTQFVKQGFVPQATLMIGHCRYSTSDILFNQPISNDRMSIVHNGVITQESPTNWKKHFGYGKFETKNDTELLLKCLSEGSTKPFTEFPNASIAAGVLHQGYITCMRNNSRPLWLMISEYFMGFASTEDIINRTAIALDMPIEAIPTEPFTQYTFLNDDIKTSKMPHTPTLFHIDQQIKTLIEDKYIKL